MALYEAIGLRDTVEKAIDTEFAQAKKSLDEIHAEEALKTPLRELMEALDGRKK
jgi:vacuolar-type H+-ATPase subunit E/Vma4